MRINPVRGSSSVSGMSGSSYGRNFDLDKKNEIQQHT
jgi:hypothetical protein